MTTINTNEMKPGMPAKPVIAWADPGRYDYGPDVERALDNDAIRPQLLRLLADFCKHKDAPSRDELRRAMRFVIGGPINMKFFRPALAALICSSPEQIEREYATLDAACEVMAIEHELQAAIVEAEASASPPSSDGGLADMNESVP